MFFRCYDVVSPTSPQLKVEEYKTPSPLEENSDRQFIPLRGDSDEVQKSVSVKSDDEESDHLPDESTTVVEKRESEFSDDALYTRIMAEAMSFAPTISNPHINLPRMDDSPKLFIGKRRSLSPVNTLHRRSYTLATKHESSDGK